MAKQIKTEDIFEKAMRDLANGVTPGAYSGADIAQLREAIKSLKAPATNGNGKHAPAAEQEGGWKVFTLKDAFTPRPPTQYLIDGIFAEGSLNMVYGAPGTLKTMLVADAGMSVACGKAWLPSLPNLNVQPIAVKKVPVLLVDFDNGARRSHERIEALARARKIDPSKDDVQLFYTSMPSPWLRGDDSANVHHFISEVKRCGARMVIIDNLGVVSGAADENSPDMSRVMGNFRYAAEDTGAAIVILHHERKSNGMSTVKGGEGLRGHSSINAALDLALLVERDGASRIINVRSTKTRDVEVDGFSAEFTYTHKEGTKELSEAMFYSVDRGSEGNDMAIERAILKAAHEPINQTKLIKAVQEIVPDVGRDRIRALATSLVGRGKLNQRGGDNNATVYSVD